MATVSEIQRALEEIAPSRYAFDFDRVGVQVGDPGAEVKRAVVSLDRSLAAVEYASSDAAQLLVAHHPLIFRPIERVTTETHVGRTLSALIRAGMSFMAAHTNWDSAKGGVNDALAQVLGLSDVRSFGAAAEIEQLKLVFFSPAKDADRLIDACSAAGAGQIGLYRRCSFQHGGVGSFIGSEGTHPKIGSPGKLEQVEEVRVEMVLRADQRPGVQRALAASHPYEEPAFDFFRLAPVSEQAIGRIGDIKDETSLSKFGSVVESMLETKCFIWGDPDRKIGSVAVVGGAADDEWRSAQRGGADVLVTGEVKQHNALEASESGFCLIAAGHYATEQPGVSELAKRLEQAVPEVEWTVFAPRPGFAGRPL